MANEGSGRIAGMTPRTFFRQSLLLPVVAPMFVFAVVSLVPASASQVAFLMPVGMVLGPLLLSLVFGVPAYVPFACVAYLLLGRLSTGRAMQILSCFAPIVFFPFEMILWLGLCYVDTTPNFRLAGCWDNLQPLAFYAAVLGYSYVAIVNLAYWGFVWRGWVGEDSGERDAG